MFSVQTTLEEFENTGFTLKTHQMFSVQTKLEEFKTEVSLWKRIKYFPFILRRRNLNLNALLILNLCFRKTRSEKSHAYRNDAFLTKLCFQNCHPQYNATPAFSNSSDLKRVFEKLNARKDVGLLLMLCYDQQFDKAHLLTNPFFLWVKSCKLFLQYNLCFIQQLILLFQFL